MSHASDFFDKVEAAAQIPNDPLTARVNKKLEQIAAQEGNPATEAELQAELEKRWKTNSTYVHFAYSEPPGF